MARRTPPPSRRRGSGSRDREDTQQRTKKGRERRGGRSYDDFEEEEEEEFEEEEEEDRPRRPSSRRGARGGSRDSSRDKGSRSKSKSKSTGSGKGRRSSNRDDRNAARQSTDDLYKQAKGHAASESNYNDNLKLTEGEFFLVFFPEKGAYDVTLQHWVDRSSGKRSFTCAKSKVGSIDEGEDCPLCDSDVSASVISMYNVLVWEDEEWVVNTLEARPMLHDVLDAADKSDREGPIHEGYFAIRRIGSKGKTNYDFRPVKEKDLVEDWDADPVDDELLDELGEDFLHPEDTYRSSFGELDDVADELVSRGSRSR